MESKTFELSLPKSTIDSGRDSALTTRAQAINANTKVGVALRIEPLPALPLARKRISGINKTTRVNLTITAESNASSLTIDAAAMTCPTSCTAAPIQAPIVGSLKPRKVAINGMTKTESVPHSVTTATA